MVARTRRIQDIVTRRGFALVMTLFLVTLLATTGAALALTASTEALVSVRQGRDLDHQLAVDSLLAILPELLASQDADAFERPGSDDAKRLEMSYGAFHIVCHVRVESAKLYMGGDAPIAQRAAGLRELARSNGLPEQNIILRPIRTEDADGKQFPEVVWFDQIIRPTEFEELFRWRLPQPDDVSPGRQRTWSDLVTFWKADRGTAYSLEVQTRFEHDVRRWYLVVSVVGEDVEVLYRGAV